MYGNSIIQRNDSQIFVKFRHKNPMSNTTIGLNFSPERINQRGLAPFQLDIRPLKQHVIAKIISRWRITHEEFLSHLGIDQDTNLLSIKPLKNQRRIRPAETEAVRHDGIQAYIILPFPYDWNAFRTGIKVGDISGDAEEIVFHHQ